MDARLIPIPEGQKVASLSQNAPGCCPRNPGGWCGEAAPGGRVRLCSSAFTSRKAFSGPDPDRWHGFRTSVPPPNGVQTLENVKGGWIEDQEVIVNDGEISEYRVLMKVTFILK